MKFSSFLNVMISLSLCGPTFASYPQDSDPSYGEKLMRELREKLNIHYPSPDGEGLMGVETKRKFCRADESQFSEIQSALLNPFVENIQQNKIDAVSKQFTKDAKVDRFDQHGTARYDSDGVNVFQWERSQAELKASPFTSFNEVKSYLKTFTKIENVDLDTFDFYIDYTWRAGGKDYNRLSAMMELRVNGSTSSGRQSDRFNLVADITKSSGKWLISSLKIMTGERVTSKRKPAFVDATSASGLADVPVHLRREAIRRGGYSAAVTDLNNDSVPDLFFGTGGESENLIGKKDKNGELTFSRSNKDLPQGTFVKSSVFADFDNDGDQDAVLVRFVQDHEHDDELVFFRNNGKGQYKYEPILNKASISKRWAMPAAVADFNADGFLDLYVGYPGKKDFTTFVQPGTDNGNDILPHGLFFNAKGSAFTNVTANVIPPFVEGAGFLYPHSALAFDYDHNRTTDLIVIDDRDNLSPMYRNNGTTFDQVAKKIGLGNSGYGMSVAIGDYNNDGLIDIAMTNVNLTAEMRFRASCDRNWNVKPDPIAQGLRLFKNEGKGNFSEVTEMTGLGWPGAATGGLVFTDYNNDGFDDIYVTNGLWSGNKKGVELDSFWATANIQNSVLSNSLKYQTNGTQSLVMNLLIHYQEEKGVHPSLGGFQRNKLYRNNGNGTFTDVAYIENVDEVADGYAVVTLDTNNDGKQEILLRNADPGTGANRFASVKLYQNNHESKNKSITITLVGTDSSKDAVGTEIIASFGGRKLVRQHIANNGPQQSQRLVHFGLGSLDNADLEIKWPNGKVEKFKRVPAGIHHYVEPSAKNKVSAN